MKKKILREILSYSKIILFSLVISYFIKDKLIANAQVVTGSMESTLMTDSRIFINRLSYQSEAPCRGDIVAFQCPDDKPDAIPLIKRILALPYETIEGIDGIIYINGEELAEPYITEIFSQDFGPYTVPENCYFMMGDNRNNSLDSRYWENKYVPKENIIGRVVIEYYPSLQIFD